MMNRVNFLWMAVACVAGLCVTGYAKAADATGQRPNFLFILTDDQRYSATGTAGGAEIKTPVMDKLAQDGLNFSQATIMGGNSPAVCMPSRAMIMTGASLFKCGGAIPAQFDTMPQVLKQNGYATFMSGKWHNDNASILRSFEYGEALFLGGKANHFKMTVNDISAGKLINERTVNGFNAEVFADSTIKFMKERPTDKPFFIYLSFRTPHDPRVVPDQYHEMYDAGKITLPPNFLPEHPFDNGDLSVRDEKLAAFPRNPEEIKKHIADYYAATTATDDQIGRVLQALQDLGLDKNTVVIFTSDNGLAVGQHGLMGKQNVYDHSIRVPLLLRGPGIPAGKKSDALCQLFDLYPTLLSMAGVAAPATADGKDLGPVIRGEKQDVHDATLHSYMNVQRAVRTHDLKLIEYFVKGVRTTQLFDLKNDPWEMKNLADDPAHSEQLKAMRAKLETLQKEYSAKPLEAGGGGAKAKKNGKSGKRTPNPEADE